MKGLFQSVQRLLSRDSLSEAFAEPASQPEWEMVEAARLARYSEVMLERIARFSELHKGFIQVPDTLYHSSVYSNLPFLDPEVGQGLGVWFQNDLACAAEIGVFRCRDPFTGKPYPDTSPSIYEASLNVKNYAVFQDEGALYQMAVHEPDDDNELRFKPYELHDLHNIRHALVSAGYDGIYLLREETFSVLDSQAIKIVREHDPYEIYYGDSSPQSYIGVTADTEEFAPE